MWVKRLASVLYFPLFDSCTCVEVWGTATGNVSLELLFIYKWRRKVWTPLVYKVVYTYGSGLQTVLREPDKLRESFRGSRMRKAKNEFCLRHSKQEKVNGVWGTLCPRNYDLKFAATVYLTVIQWLNQRKLDGGVLTFKRCSGQWVMYMHAYMHAYIHTYIHTYEHAYIHIHI
jgi:hypothetical protein